MTLRFFRLRMKNKIIEFAFGLKTLMNYVTNTEIGDATDPALIESFRVKDFDLCVLTIYSALLCYFPPAISIQIAKTPDKCPELS